MAFFTRRGLSVPEVPDYVTFEEQNIPLLNSFNKKKSTEHSSNQYCLRFNQSNEPLENLKMIDRHNGVEV